MTFSIGQNLNMDILNFSNKSTNNPDMSIEQTRELQQRAANWFKNNQYSVLFNSQKYNTSTNLPLGGEINLDKIGNDNVKGSCDDGFCGDFRFWDLANCSNKAHTKKEYFKKDNNQLNNNRAHHHPGHHNPGHHHKSDNDDNSKNNTKNIILILSIIMLIAFIIAIVLSLVKYQ